MASYLWNEFEALLRTTKMQNFELNGNCDQKMLQLRFYQVLDSKLEC